MKQQLVIRQAEVAEMLGVSRQVVAAMTRDRRIPHLKIGKRTVYSPEAIRAWIVAESQRQLAECV